MISCKMISKVKLNNRNAFEIINALRNFDGSIYIEKTCEQQRVNAKSLLGLLSLSVVNGEEINIIICNEKDNVDMIFDAIKSVLQNE